SSTVLRAVARKHWALLLVCHTDTRGDDSLEERLGLSLPPGSCVWYCGRRSSVVDAVQSFSATGRRSWLLRSLARRELGLDRGAADIPFRLQYRPSDLPLRSSLSRTEIQEPSLRDWNSVQHPWSYHRLLCPIRA